MTIMLKPLLFFIGMFIPFVVHAGKFPDEFKGKCEKKIKTQALRLGFSNEKWIKQIALDEKTSSYKQPGKKIGEWALLEKFQDGTTTISVQKKNKNVYQYSFLKNNCTVRFTARSPATDTSTDTRTDNETPNPKLQHFKDADLETLLSNTHDGVIYVWSPGMPLSIDGIIPIKQAATSLKLSVTYLMDPIADQSEAENIAKEKSLPDEFLKRMESDELGAYDIILHYPALIVYKSGKLCPVVQRGVRDREEYAANIKEMNLECGK